jgi:hypothetical protein
MCEVATIAALATAAIGAAGTGMQMAGQQRADDSRAAAAMQATRRQRDMNNAAMAGVSPAIDATERSRVDDSMAQAQGQRADTYAGAINPQTEYLPSQSTAPQVVRDAVDRARGENADYLGQRADALARLGSWGDTLFGLRTGVQRANENSAVQGSLSRGAAGLLPGAMAAAGSAGSGLRQAGDLAVFGSQMGSAFGPSTWGSVFGPTAQNTAAGGAAKSPWMASTGRYAGPI